VTDYIPDPQGAEDLARWGKFIKEHLPWFKSALSRFGKKPEKTPVPNVKEPDRRTLSTPINVFVLDQATQRLSAAAATAVRTVRSVMCDYALGPSDLQERLVEEMTPAINTYRELQFSQAPIYFDGEVLELSQQLWDQLYRLGWEYYDWLESWLRFRTDGDGRRLVSEDRPHERMDAIDAIFLRLQAALGDEIRRASVVGDTHT